MKIDSRKEAILEAVVREFSETGVPVGSLTLVKKYALPFSSATIRAEMSELERMGYLSQPHTSAGRVPTEKGYRYYVNLISDEAQLMERSEIVVKKRLESFQDRFEKKLEAASQILSELTNNMGFAGFLNDIHFYGLSNLFSYPELLDYQHITKAAEIVDNLDLLLRELPRNFGTRIYIGSEIPIGKSAGCSMIVTEFHDPLENIGYLGVIGPLRMSYQRSLSAINEVKETIENENEKSAKKRRKK